MHPAFTRIDHRPWPLPPRRWIGRQRWCDLLFAHWPVNQGDLRPLVPAALELDEFDGTSWVGVVPFRMEDVTLRGFPAVPFLSAFPELNLRLYVKHGGKPGVWFLSLDTTSRLSVWGARKFFHLPYFRASMTVDAARDSVRYASLRDSDRSIVFRSTYAPVSAPYESAAGTLEHFLTERYCLYAQAPDGTIERTDIHHHPWPLQKAEVEIEENTLATPFGFRLTSAPPLMHFAHELDVVVWRPVRSAGFQPAGLRPS